MRKIFLSMFLVFFIFSPALGRIARAADTHADLVYASSLADVVSPSKALDAPDGAYTEFLDDETYLTLDMGEGEEGMGDLTLTIAILDYGARGYITLYDSSWAVLRTYGNIFSLGSTSFTVTYDGETPYRYVKIESQDTERWKLDAVTAASAAQEEPEEPITDEPVVTDEPDVDSITYGEDMDGPGSLIRTESSSSVYLVGEDWKRHPFPNEAIFDSWGYSFDNVEYVSDETMAGYHIGKNVTVRPGTWLVKVTYDPKVYAVEPDGVLRWILTERLADDLYGSAWSTERTIDVNEVFWTNYSVGDAVESATYPDGTVLRDIDDETVYLSLSDSSLRELSDEEVTELRIVEEFIIEADIGASDLTEPTDGDLNAYVHAY